MVKFVFPRDNLWSSGSCLGQVRPDNRATFFCCATSRGPRVYSIWSLYYQTVSVTILTSVEKRRLYVQSVYVLVNWSLSTVDVSITVWPIRHLMQSPVFCITTSTIILLLSNIFHTLTPFLTIIRNSMQKTEHFAPQHSFGLHYWTVSTLLPGSCFGCKRCMYNCFRSNWQRLPIGRNDSCNSYWGLHVIWLPSSHWLDRRSSGTHLYNN